jgi:hypothetical protein
VAGLFGWGARKPEEASAPERPLETTSTSVVFPRFLGALAPRPSPVILDLGPAVGTNVSFLGERLACKLLIGDLFHEVRAVKSDAPDDLRAALMARLERTVTSPLDGVLCWEAFDYLNRATAQAVAAFLVQHLQPGGVIHGFFAAAAGDIDRCTRYIIQGPSTLTCRYESVPTRRRGVLPTRDLAAMFVGTNVMESVLLKSQRREILLRKG